MKYSERLPEHTEKLALYQQPAGLFKLLMRK